MNSIFDITKSLITYFLINKKFQTMIKIVIFFSSLIFIYTRINLNNLNFDITKFNYYFFFIIFFLQTIAALLVLLRWKKLLEISSDKIYKIKQLIPTIIYSNISISFNFLSFFLTRLIFASKQNIKVKELLSTTIVEKILSIYSLILIFIFSIVIGKTLYELEIMSELYYIYIISIYLLSFSLFFLILINLFFNRISNTLQNIFILKYFLSYLKFKNNIYPFLLTFFLQFCFFLILLTIPFMLGINLNFFNFFIFLPVVTFVSALPISLTQWGYRESVFIFFYGLIGIDSNTIFIISITYGILSVLIFVSHIIIYELLKFYTDKTKIKI